MTRDARHGEVWSRAQRLKNTLIYWILRAALAVADRVPEALLCVAGRGLGRIAWWLLPGARRIAIRNVARTLAGCAPAEIARASFVAAGQNLALSLLLRRPGTRVLDRVMVDAPTRALLHAALTRGSAVFVSAHFGPFELIAPRVVALGFPASVVVRQSYDRRLDAVVDRHRQAHGVTVIHRGGARGAAAMRRALRGRTLLGLLVDLPGRGTRRTESMLFGRAGRLAAGPTVLGARMGVPVLVGVLKPRTHDTYDLVVESLTSDAEHAIGRALEGAVRAAPEQWLWMGDPLGLRG